VQADWLTAFEGLVRVHAAAVPRSDWCWSPSHDGRRSSSLLTLPPAPDTRTTCCSSCARRSSRRRRMGRRVWREGR